MILADGPKEVLELSRLISNLYHLLPNYYNNLCRLNVFLVVANILSIMEMLQARYVRPDHSSCNISNPCSYQEPRLSHSIGDNIRIPYFAKFTLLTIWGIFWKSFQREECSIDYHWMENIYTAISSYSCLECIIFQNIIVHISDRNSFYSIALMMRKLWHLFRAIQ